MKIRSRVDRFQRQEVLLHRRGDEPMDALPEIFRMALSQRGIGRVDAERRKRPHLRRVRPRAAEPGMELVDLPDGKHDRCGIRGQ